jgi:hypothetical protein
MKERTKCGKGLRGYGRNEYLLQCKGLVYQVSINDLWKWMVSLLLWYYLTAIGLTPGGSGTAHIYAQTIHRIRRTEHS